MTAKILSFQALRAANLERLPQFKNRHGQIAHAKADGSDWTRADWLEALAGELGEYANISKKFRRGDIDAVTFYNSAREELADVMVYLDILAHRLGIDLAAAVQEKFNDVSRRVHCSVFISDNGEVVRDESLIRE